MRKNSAIVRHFKKLVAAMEKDFDKILAELESTTMLRGEVEQIEDDLRQAVFNMKDQVEVL